MRQDGAHATGLRLETVETQQGVEPYEAATGFLETLHLRLQFINAVALETVRTGVTCNAICPGWVLTPLVQKQIDDLAAREKLSPEEAKIRLLGEKQPSLEFTTPEQLGALAVFLCSEAASNMHGVALPMDGAWLAQ